MKILFPSLFYLPHVVGGIEYYIHNLAKGLLLKGYDVKIALPEFEDGPVGNYEYEGVPVVRYKGFTSVGKLQMAGLEPNESLYHFKKLLLQEQPDIVHFNQLTNSSGISLEHIAAPKEWGMKVVYTNHMSEFLCQRGDLMYLGKRVCDGTVTVKKCTLCIMNKRGISQPAAYAALAADTLLAKITGQKNFLRQVKPVTFPGFSSRWQIYKIKSIIDSADVFVSIAEWSTKLLKQNGWYKKNCITIQTGLLTGNIEKNTGTLKYGGKRSLKIIYVGRIFLVKGLDVLIKALKAIDINTVELNIYGPAGAINERVYYNYCRDLAKENTNILFHREADNTQVVKLMSENDMLCIPSRGNEMSPLVIQEAMAAGIPVIGADLPAVKEWVSDGQNGLVFCTGDSDSLKKKLLLVINNPSLLEIFKQNIVLPLSFKNTIDSYEKLYKSF